MSVLVAIPYSLSDNEYSLHLTLVSIRHTLGNDVDILVITDEDTPWLFVPTKIYQARL